MEDSRPSLGGPSGPRPDLSDRNALIEYLHGFCKLPDVDLVRKSVKSLVKNLSGDRAQLRALLSVLEEAEAAVLDSQAGGDSSVSTTPPSGRCVSLARTKDGRIQVAGRKFFPHVLFCRLFRWPNLRNKNELLRTSKCAGHHILDDSEETTTCINPYHFDLFAMPPHNGYFGDEAGESMDGCAGDGPPHIFRHLTHQSLHPPIPGMPHLDVFAAPPPSLYIDPAWAGFTEGGVIYSHAYTPYHGIGVEIAPAPTSASATSIHSSNHYTKTELFTGATPSQTSVMFAPAGGGFNDNCSRDESMDDAPVLSPLTPLALPPPEWSLHDDVHIPEMYRVDWN